VKKPRFFDKVALSGAGFQTCCVADFQVGITALPPAGLETRDTADLEVCVTLNRYRPAALPCREGGFAVLHPSGMSIPFELARLAGGSLPSLQSTRSTAGADCAQI
jgi:hypothetical protein